MKVGQVVKNTLIVGGAILLLNHVLKADPSAADKKFFFSSQAKSEQPMQDTTRTKVKQIVVDTTNDGNLNLLKYTYDDGTDGRGSIVLKYPHPLSVTIVSDYIILDYMDKVVVCRPNLVSKKEDVVFEKKPGITCKVEPKTGESSKLTVTNGDVLTEVSHDSLGRLKTSNSGGKVIEE